MKRTMSVLTAVFLVTGCAIPPRSALVPSAPGTPLGAEGLASPAAQVDLYLGVVEGLIRQGRFQAAIAFLAKYQKNAPQTTRFRKLTADALNGAGRHDEAITSYRSLLSSEYAAAAYAGIGRAQSATGDWPSAEESFRQAAVLDPANATYLNNLGFSRLRQNLTSENLQQAVEVLQRAYELAPGSSMIRNNLALAEARAGQKAQLLALLGAIPDAANRKQLADFVTNWSGTATAPAVNAPAVPAVKGNAP
jgi:Flp pilus assembly protein TadD